jgi:hypothetical protein
MRPVFIIVFAAVLQFTVTSSSLRGDVIISEIMYNPSSKESFNPDENLVEWIEIYNSGDSPVDITGWFLQDEEATPSRCLAIRPFAQGKQLFWYQAV